MTKRAYLAIRTAPHYRHASFADGLRRAGWMVDLALPGAPPKSGDVLVLWNRYGHHELVADKWEREGGQIFVAENGYLGHDAGGIQYYALALHGHNGSGQWPQGGGERFAAMMSSQPGIEPKPWRAEGAHIFVRGQRGIGTRQMASPQGWHQNIAAQLRARTKRQIVVKEHPGKPANAIGEQLAADLAGAHACVIWSSAVGVKALIEGIPVFYSAPHWICAGAAKQGVQEIDAPLMDDAKRLAALERMAWAQWTIAELATGEPFVRLLESKQETGSAA